MKNTAADFQQMVEALLPQLSQYIADSQERKVPVLKQKLASDLAEDLQLSKWIREGGLTVDTMNELLDPYLAYSQHMHHPRYIGHQVSSHHLASGIADVVQGAINNPMAIYEMGPSASVIEQTIINWMLEKAGWLTAEGITDYRDIHGNGGGILTHGGSMANLTAMLAARAAIAPEAWTEGAPTDLVVLGSEVAHYSVARAISMMGMGKNAMVAVKVDANEVLRADDLYRAYRTAIDTDKRVMAVVANACATSTGLYDPVEEIGLFCKEHNLWYHVDGAHGASALVHPKTKHYLNGLQYADSMIWDTHKMLRTTTLCAAVLFRDARSLHATFQQKGSYLFHEKEQLGFDLMPYAIECTKAAIGTKLLWVLAAEGEQGIADYVKGRYDFSRSCYDFIQSQPDFECPYEPEANILCFKYSAASDNKEQLALRNTLVKNGNFYITSAEVGGVRYLRMTIINALTDMDDIAMLLDEIRQIASGQPETKD